MTKKWSSTKSMDGQTKRQASKMMRRESNREVVMAVRKMNRNATGEMEKCKYCGNYHGGHCPLVRAIEYFPNGMVKRVEYHESRANEAIINWRT